ncbi:succinylglutamate desuccinylase [Pseudomonas syringae pv. tomato]|uniref:Succinylglutamate desuccinylase n=1 Tax=Pseudomonas syringae pv. tomato TaxID=323 RepID=A0AB36KNI3_PSEUB|nr:MULTISPECIES: succinylglutamate desuccinylase [Pseudomonas]KPB81789.1 Succinylglutamate desuccinylase [Pseudomonas syringae pv. maculicola]MBI6846222.1 succinylglutamate desuccinylase [Pseudomonas syringae]MBX6512127.1 succinylglutamate desuccinylase [Pseudomonas syringae pv. tomato]OPE58251.1 succinylglutamate desuccinylase [Pseudomonas syringae pv. tomato]RMU96918.1 Succinylglutamate desuccinylase [Pseudomonas syringae pv. tomato]
MLNGFLPLTLVGGEPPARRMVLPYGVSVEWLAHGVLLIEPARPARLSLMISAGIHGNETAPVEMVDRLLTEIASGGILPRCRLLIVLGHPEALSKGVRYLDHDMNRLFNGRHSTVDAVEAPRAAQLETIAKEFFKNSSERLHYDLHTAIRDSHVEQFALYPWMPGRALPLNEAERLGSAGIEAIVTHSQKGSTFSAYTYEALGAESFTLELGKARPFGQNARVDVRALQRMLALLIEGHEPESGVIPQRFDVSRTIRKETAGFILTLDRECPNFEVLPKGMSIASDGDVDWVIQEEDAVILFPNPDVAVGLRAGLVLVPHRK